jgi:hypothetical protein
MCSAKGEVMVLLAMAVGAGAIALWIDVRFPGLEPRGFGQRLLLNVMTAAVVSRFVAPSLMDAAGESMSGRFVAIFAIGLPAAVYVLLVSIWILKLLQSAVAGGRLR